MATGAGGTRRFNNDLHIGSARVRIYADPQAGANRLLLVRNSLVGNINGSVTLSGYLVDL